MSMRAIALLFALVRTRSESASDAADGSLPRLSVRKVDVDAAGSLRRFVIVDEWGREVTLRGVDLELQTPTLLTFGVAAYANGSCPVNKASYPLPPICEVDAGAGRYGADTRDTGQNDLAQVRALGFNLIRLCLSWDRMEPTPGQYDEAYIARVAQIVSWAREQGIYVALDMHQDLFSSFVSPSHGTHGLPPFLYPSNGQDGAPAWAVQSTGWPSIALLGVDQLNPAMLAAFEALWRNKVITGVKQGSSPGPGLQDHLIGALASLAARFANDTTVMGIELMNEPQPGMQVSSYAASAGSLYPFYRRAVQAITGVRDGLPTCAPGNADVKEVGITCAYPDAHTGYTGLILTEPLAIRNMVDRSLQSSVPWTSYAHVVHCPHVYTHVFTLDVTMPWLAALLLPTPWPPSWRYAYDTAWAEAAAMHSAVLVTEFGNSVSRDASAVRPTLDAQDATSTPASLWAWKVNCLWGWPDGAQRCLRESWTMFAPAQGPPHAHLPPNGVLLPSRVRLMSRTHSRGTVGEVNAYGYNTSTRGFFLTANVSFAQWTALGVRERAWGRARGGAGAGGDILLSDWTVDPTGFYPSLPRVLSQQGIVSEVYIPPTVSWPVTVVSGSGSTSLRNVVTWPDGARTAYVRIGGKGSYGVLVLDLRPTPMALDGSLLARTAFHAAHVPWPGLP